MKYVYPDQISDGKILQLLLWTMNYMVYSVLYLSLFTLNYNVSGLHMGDYGVEVLPPPVARIIITFSKFEI